MPIAMPKERRLCKRCSKLRYEDIPPACAPCLFKNIEYYPDDAEAYVKAAAQYQDLRMRKKYGLKYKMPRGKYVRKVGLSNYTPEQMARYNKILAGYLQRAKENGKRTDGLYGNPYRLAAMRWTTGNLSGPSYLPEYRKRISTKWRMLWYLKIRSAKRNARLRKIAENMKSPDHAIQTRSKQTL